MLTEPDLSFLRRMVLNLLLVLGKNERIAKTLRKTDFCPNNF